ncbi:MAG: FAD-binding oxidoreductase [Myxococcota bacterium]
MSNPVIELLEKELGSRVRTDGETLASHRHDSWVLSELLDLEGSPGPSPIAVVFPSSAEEVARCVRVCREARVPLVPYGGGSGVCGAIRVGEGSVVLSTRELAGLLDLNRESLTATFAAGTLGLDAENRMQEEGFTIGHWPQSVEISTVGGWVATRASGQFSSRYGSIEDLVLALEVVLPNGQILRTPRTPRSSAGPDLKQLFMGSEGLLGVVTSVTFSLHPLPAATRRQAFHFGDLQEGLGAIRGLMHAGWRPPVIRLYDAAESARLFGEWCPEGRALLILLHEGAEAALEVESASVADLCGAAGGSRSDPGAVDHWFEHRNRVPGFREFLERGIILDTVEVAATWDRVGDLYTRVTRSLSEVSGILVASGHSSHSYRSGTNLYMTFVARPDEASQMASTYRECWRRIMEATLASGGGIAHHHGIGRIRRGVLEREIGQTGVDLLRSIKRALDPDGLLNPGALLPDPDEGA